MENQNQSPKAQLIERLKQANNVLVTVSRNPSVDQLSAAIGLTLMLNHLEKHATAVFSGEVPNTLEFLKPEETIEKTTDSLRDFIISLDKTKADKLRYKVEDKMVKIFITPYRTSLTEADLVFGQGDFNVDVVVAIGVQEKEDLDEAITSHGRILHDATVVTVNTTTNGQIGSLNWVDAKASSLSEMLVPVCEGLKAGALDAQMSTAFLTGIVAETQRFSNEKTSSDTMSISSKLMAAGANQQLVATKLEQLVETPPAANSDANQAQSADAGELNNDGSLDINHNEPENAESDESTDLPEIQPDHQPEQDESPMNLDGDKPSRLILEPPTLGGKLTANSEPEGLDPSTDPLTLVPIDSPLLTHESDETVPEKPAFDPVQAAQEPAPEPEPPKAPEMPEPPVVTEDPVPLAPPLPEPAPEPPQLEPVPQPQPTPEPQPEPVKPDEDDTLSEIESAVGSPHVVDGIIEEHQADQPEAPSADEALAAAHEAFDAIAPATPEKPAAFNASGPMEVPHEETSTDVPQEPANEEKPIAPVEDDGSVEPAPIQIDPSTGMISYPTNLVPISEGLPTDPTAASVEDPTAPPEVPPPIPPTMMPPIMPPHEPPTDPNNLPPVTP